MTYKDALTAAMTLLAADERRRFIGYGLRIGRAIGTMRAVRDEQIVETTVAENLMVGLATGLSVAGLKPVVYFERMDFAANAVDAIVNHLTKIKQLSRGEFRPAAIIRCTVGNRAKPLFTGPTHTQDFTCAFDAFDCGLWIAQCKTPQDVLENYEMAARMVEHGRSAMVVEFKDLA